MRNRRGPRTLPCGTPLRTLEVPDAVFPTVTYWLRLIKKFLIHFKSFPLIPHFLSFLKSIRWEIVSKALLISRYKTSVYADLQ